MKNQLLLFAVFLLLIYSCRTYQAKPYDFPKPVDTTTKLITLQEKKVFASLAEGVFADNLFDGARLNGFHFIQKDTFRATISPENKPINPSPYYAFRLWANGRKPIVLELNYTDAKHRYEPKISADGQHWELLNSKRVHLAPDSINAFLTLDLSADTLWVAAQEVQNSNQVRQWCSSKAKSPGVQLSCIGKSLLGRDMLFLDINEGNPQKKDVIVLLSRQHPPEVTGWFALQSFLEVILGDNPLSNAFRKKYRVMVFPLMNPDGVDLGHWRHNAGGIDLNRDWAFYHQPETRQVADFIVRSLRKSKAKVILGLDFHSTFWDVYYTNREIPKHLPGFKDFWLRGIENSIGKEPNERPSNIGAPVSKNWFLTQFDAPGVTYEIGDSTPRDFIRKKGQVSAIEMMELLIFK